MSRRSQPLLACLLALGCAGAEQPFHVEHPLTRTAHTPADAQVPLVRVDAPRPPSVLELRLANGLRGRALERPGSRLVSLVYVNPRARMSVDYLPVFLGDALLAGVRGADGKLMHPVALDGQQPSVQTGLTGTTISLSCSAERFEQALELLAAVVQRPAFEASWMARVRASTMLDLLRIRGLYSDWWLASEHRDESFIVQEERVAERMGDVDREQLVRAHRELFRPGDATLIVVGDVTAARALGAIQTQFAAWSDAAAVASAAEAAAPLEAAKPATRPKHAREARKVLLLGGHGYPSFTLIQAAPEPDSDDAMAFELLSGVLAGDPSSRLMASLREAQGHAYFVSGRSVRVPARGSYWLLNSSVAARTLVEDVSVALKELELARTSLIDAQRLAGAKARYSAALSQRLSSGDGLASYLRDVALRDAPPLEVVVAQLQATTPEDLRRVAQRYLDPEHATIAVEGDLGGSASALSTLGNVSTP